MDARRRDTGHIRDTEDAAMRRSQPGRHHRYFDVAPLGERFGHRRVDDLAAADVDPGAK